MAGNVTIYTLALQNTCKALIDWSSANIRTVLLTSSYTPDATATGHSTWADVSTYQVSGTGYTAGGLAVASPSVTSSASTVSASYGTLSWPSSTITCRYMVLVLSTGGATPNSTDKILCYDDLGSGSNISTTNGTLTINGYTVSITHSP